MSKCKLPCDLCKTCKNSFVNVVYSKEGYPLYDAKGCTNPYNYEPKNLESNENS